MQCTAETLEKCQLTSNSHAWCNHHRNPLFTPHPLWSDGIYTCIFTLWCVLCSASILCLWVVYCRMYPFLVSNNRVQFVTNPLVPFLPWWRLRCHWHLALWQTFVWPQEQEVTSLGLHLVTLPFFKVSFPDCVFQMSLCLCACKCMCTCVPAYVYVCIQNWERAWEREVICATVGWWLTCVLLLCHVHVILKLFLVDWNKIQKPTVFNKNNNTF